MRHKAIIKLYPECIGVVDGVGAYGPGNKLIEVDETLVAEKILQLKNEEPMRLLREERDRRIAETDWWVLPDRTASQEQKDYRQALRDLPSTTSPKIENGQLINVTWPTKPT